MNDRSAMCVVLDEQIEISLSEICHVCNCHAEWVVELVAEGILDPMGNDQKQWRFSGSSLQKALAAMRLERDLGLNIAGVALVLDLMEELAELRERLERLEVENTK